MDRLTLSREIKHPVSKSLTWPKKGGCTVFTIVSIKMCVRNLYFAHTLKYCTEKFSQHPFEISVAIKVHAHVKFLIHYQFGVVESSPWIFGDIRNHLGIVGKNKGCFICKNKSENANWKRFCTNCILDFMNQLWRNSLSVAVYFSSPLTLTPPRKLLW